MMNYNEFKVAFVEGLKERFAGETVEEVTVSKTNETVDAVMIRQADSKCSPTIYLGTAFREYQSNCDLDAVLDRVVEVLSSSENHPPRLDFINDPVSNASEIKSHIVFDLINAEWNREQLKDLPHREVLDLAVVYRVVIESEDEARQSFLIKNFYAEKLGLDEETLYDLAKENTPRMFPGVVMNMASVMQIFEVDATNEEMPMWVVSNKQRVCGASAILYEGIFDTLVEKYDTDLFVLPSSTHEMIVVPEYMGDIETFSQMVREINRAEVDRQEQLSDSVYIYHKETGALELATSKASEAVAV